MDGHEDTCLLGCWSCFKVRVQIDQIIDTLKAPKFIQGSGFRALKLGLGFRVSGLGRKALVRHGFRVLGFAAF